MAWEEWDQLKARHAADDSYIGGAVSSVSTLDKGFDDRKGH
ncbi:hypothetical protein ACIGXF_35015 [Streptomyces sp. NPDC053086]